MSGYPDCPCCSYELIRRVSSRGTVWFCSHCYQEMPVHGLSDFRKLAALGASVQVK